MNLNRVLKSPQINLVIFLFLFLSLLAAPDLFSLYIYNITPIRIFLPLISLLGIYANREKLSKVLRDPIFKALSLYCVYLSLSVFYTVDFKDYFELLAFHLNLTLFYTFLFTISGQIKRSLESFEICWLAVLAFTNVASVIVFIYHFYIFFTGKYWGPLRVVSTITDENHYAFYLVMAILFLVYLIVSKLKSPRLLVYYLLLSSGVILSGLRSRSGFLSLSLSILLVSIFYWRFGVSKKIILNCLAVIFFSVLIGFAIFRPFSTTGSVYYISGSEHTATEIGDKKVIYTTPRTYKYFDYIVEDKMPEFLSEASVKSHLALIYSSFYLGLKHPLVGVGLGSFNEYMKSEGLLDLYARYDPQAASSTDFPSHTMYGQVFAETGLIGLLMYLYVLALIITHFYSEILNSTKTRHVSIAFFGMCVGYLVFSFFYNLHEEWFWIPLFLGIFLTKESD